MSLKRSRTQRYEAPGAIGASYRSRSTDTRIYFSGRDLVKEVKGTLTNTPTSFVTALNQRLYPCNSFLFPWLSKIASNFEQYRIHSCVFRYEPSCSTATGGEVIMMVDPDSEQMSNGTPPNMQSIANIGTHVHGAPWAKHVLTVPRSYLTDRPKYYNYNPLALTVSTGFDPLEHYIGRFVLMTNQLHSLSAPLSTEVNIGNLWVEYTVSFTKSEAVRDSIQALGDFHVSPIIASNSGIGCLLNVPNPAEVVSDCLLIGAGSINTNIHGDEYWLTSSTGIATVKTDVQLLCNAVFVGNQMGTTDPDFTIVGQGTSELVTSTYSDWSTPQKHICIYKLQLFAGDKITFTVGTVAVGDAFTSVKLFFAPFPVLVDA